MSTFRVKTLACCPLLVATLTAFAAEPTTPVIRLPDSAQFNVSPEQLLRALTSEGKGDWKPAVNTVKTRGSGVLVYAKVAPAVVVVRTAKGHGTGFLIDPEGWVVTNHHVVRLAELDPKTGAMVAQIHLGRIEDGYMQLVEKPIPAFVYKIDEVKDLALLKLSSLPAGAKTVPHVELVSQVPGPGSDCVVIGHPASSLLWSVRSGEITGAGAWPKDRSDLLMKTLASSPSDRDQIQTLLARVPQRKILISSCGINSGDSGGPLFDSSGKLIGVTFAMPIPGEGGTARIGYHVHLDEVKAFLAARPKTPLLPALDLYPPGLLSTILDMDGDGIPDTLLFGMERGKEATGAMLDLKQESLAKLKSANLADPAQRNLLKFQFVVHFGTTNRAYYATSGDAINQILIDHKGGGLADVVQRRDKDGVWTQEDGKDRKIIDPSLFESKALQDRFAKITERFGQR